jgi:general nucleoside transport system permease protein
MIASHDIADVAMAFWNGSIGARSAFLSGTLVRLIPLALIGTGLAIAFRAGVFNIGGEGQFLVGAVAATIMGLVSGDAPAPLAIAGALIASVIAGASWAAIAAVLRARFGVLEVISTIMLNFVAVDLVSFLVRGPLQEPTHVYPQTSSIADAAHLPIIVPGTRLHIGILLAVVASVGAWLLMTRTALGFRFRVVGASPSAARVSGRIDIARTSSFALMLSGALAGLAGGIEITGVTYALYENLSPGYGFSAIAVAILAGLNPLGVLLSAFGFAVLESGALGMQRDAGVPAVAANAIEAIVILAIVAWGAGARRTGWLRFRRPVSPGSSQ